MLRYRVLRWMAPLCWGQFQYWVYCASWAMLRHYMLMAQHAVEDAEDQLDYMTDVVADEAASLVKESFSKEGVKRRCYK